MHLDLSLVRLILTVMFKCSLPFAVRVSKTRVLTLLIRELKRATFLSTRTATGSEFAKKVTSHDTEIKSQTLRVRGDKQKRDKVCSVIHVNHRRDINLMYGNF